MTTITKEQAQKIIDAADEVITALAGTNDDVHPDNSTKMVRFYDDLNDHYATPEVVRELARIALASLEAKPVAWECGENIILFNPDTVEAYAKRVEISPKPLYAAPPAPVVPEKMNFSTACNFVQINGMAKEDRATLAMRAWNACRTAMLNGGKS